MQAKGEKMFTIPIWGVFLTINSIEQLGRLWCYSDDPYSRFVPIVYLT